MLNILSIQDDILEHLQNSLEHTVAEVAIPDTGTVIRDARGDITPYIAVQIGDLQVQYTGRGFAGVRYDDHELPVYIQSIAPEARGARIMSTQVYDALLGMKFNWTGQIRKRPGGLMWPLQASNGATEAYMFPTSFAVTVQLADV